MSEIIKNEIPFSEKSDFIETKLEKTEKQFKRLVKKNFKLPDTVTLFELNSGNSVCFAKIKGTPGVVLGEGQVDSGVVLLDVTNYSNAVITPSKFGVGFITTMNELTLPKTKEKFLQYYNKINETILSNIQKCLDAVEKPVSCWFIQRRPLTVGVQKMVIDLEAFPNSTRKEGDVGVYLTCRFGVYCVKSTT